MTFQASDSEVQSGLKAQAIVLLVLQKTHHDAWQETRPLIEAANPGMRPSEVNFEEKKRGDLINLVLTARDERSWSIEVQCGPWDKANCIWKHSKRVLCKARWQAFFFERTYELIMIETSVLDAALTAQNIQPTPVKGDSYYTLGPGWLLSNGGSWINEWVCNNRVDGPSPG